MLAFTTEGTKERIFIRCWSRLTHNL